MVGEAGAKLRPRGSQTRNNRESKPVVENIPLLPRGLSSSWENESPLAGLDRKAFIVNLAGGEYDLHHRYDEYEVLAKGSFGKVRLVRDKMTDDLRVCKTVKKEELSRGELISIRKEIEALKRLDHPHIVRLFAYEEDVKEFHLVMEMLPGGDCKKLVECNPRMDEQFVAQLTKDLLVAMAYCHSLGVVHRDIKPENLMLTSTEAGFARGKVIDFGLSALFRRGERHLITQAVGTVLFMAPEVINELPYGDAADIWSIGATCYQMLCGHVPFDALDFKTAKKKISKAELKFRYSDGWHERSSESRDFIRALMRKDPSKRYTAAEALRHPWILKNAPTISCNTNLSREGIREYLHSPNFVKACLLLIATELDTKEVEDIQAIFEAYDKNGDGYITKADLQLLFAEQEGTRSDENIDFADLSLVDLADLNNNGVIDFSEFVAACLYQKLMDVQMDEQRAQYLSRHAFEVFDRNGDGCVSVLDIRNIIETPQVKNLEDRLNIDYCDVLVQFPNDHCFTFEEFHSLLYSSRHNICMKLCPSFVYKERMQNGCFRHFETDDFPILDERDDFHMRYRRNAWFCC